MWRTRESVAHLPLLDYCFKVHQKREFFRVTKQILLYGNSIFLTGLAVQLESHADLQARHQAPHNGLLYLGDIDIIIVDFDAIEAADVLDILRARPDLKVVDVSASGGAVMVLSGQVYLARSLTDVVDCLE